MASKSPILRLWRGSGRFKRSTGGVAALEFALIGPIFIALIILLFEFSLDLVWQSSLDTALDLAARKIQTGNAKTAASGADFVATYICPNLIGLVACDQVSVRVQKISPTGQQDYYDFTSVQVPSNGTALDLSSYSSAGFCNAGPRQLLLVSAIFTAPTLLSSLVPGVPTLSYNGAPVHAVFSSVAVETEGYWTPAAGGGTAAPC